MEKYDLGLNEPVHKYSTPDVVKNTSEKLDIKVKLATQNDWQICKEIRLLSITGEDAKMMGMTPEKVEEEKNKTEEEWREETLSNDMFSVLAWNNQEVVGLGRTRRVKNKVWRIRNGYVKPEFRNMGTQQKMFALRLNEIIKRGGVKAVTAIRIDNPVSFRNAEKFGFKEISLIRKKIELGDLADQWHMLELNLKNSEVIKKIDDVLNAG